MLPFSRLAVTYSDSTLASSSSSPNACLMLADGTIFWGYGVGAIGTIAGEVVFNTAITGYQEVLTDPSYAGQIIAFTFPHVGNVGVNPEDFESRTPAAHGCLLRASITKSSNWRATASLDSWLRSYNLIGLCGIDTRYLTHRICNLGSPNGVIAHAIDESNLDLNALHRQAQAWSSDKIDLVRRVTCCHSYQWSETTWQQGRGFGQLSRPRCHVVVIDYGIKLNILRNLAAVGCLVTVVPATTSAQDILQYQPDGIFLSNGPGDPVITGVYTVPVVQQILHTGLPIFGICLGHQILAIALGARTFKMHTGHRGANQPVKDIATGRVEITSQNHGFCVDRTTLPSNVVETHVSLFDGSLEGLRVRDRPIFSVQYHPEASPGPQDSCNLFQHFVDTIEDQKTI